MVPKWSKIVPKSSQSGPKAPFLVTPAEGLGALRAPLGAFGPLFSSRRSKYKGSQNGPKIVPKWFQNGPKIVPKLSQNCSQNGPKMFPKWSQSDPKVVL